MSQRHEATRLTAEEAAARFRELRVPPSRGLYSNSNPLFDFTRASIEALLKRPFERTWSVQGFGMIRTRFGESDRWRLNIWDSRLAVPNVSIIHDHPWNFKSWVIAGRFTNQRYRLGTIDYENSYVVSAASPNHQCMTIKTGEGAEPVSVVSNVYLHPGQPEQYAAGESYAQSRSEIHASHYCDGTVTLNSRTGREGENARVFWPMGEKWVDAEPRPATDEEIWKATRHALNNWF